VAEVEFSEWTRRARRQPSYKGLRGDNPLPSAHERPASDVVLDGKRELRLSNLDKVFWPDEGITKGDLVDYYVRSPCSSTSAAGRSRCAGTRTELRQGVLPEDAPRTCRTGFAPSHAGLDARGKEKVVDFPVGTTSSLLWMVNMGCIDMNPGIARGQADRPDFVLFDLDPTPECRIPRPSRSPST
jgi:bifunctional non-homologous end joining protein LigD